MDVIVLELYIMCCVVEVFFVKEQRPPRSTPLYSSAASDLYKIQQDNSPAPEGPIGPPPDHKSRPREPFTTPDGLLVPLPVSFTQLRAHETKAKLVCRLLPEKKKNKNKNKNNKKRLLALATHRPLSLILLHVLTPLRPTSDALIDVRIKNR